jgi:hypothetical protein
MARHKEYGLDVLEEMFRDSSEELYGEVDCGA